MFKWFVHRFPQHFGVGHSLTVRVTRSANWNGRERLVFVSATLFRLLWLFTYFHVLDRSAVQWQQNDSRQSPAHCTVSGSPSQFIHRAADYTALRADATSDMEEGMGGPTNSSFEEVIRHTFFNLKIYSYEMITCDTIIASFCWACSWLILKHCGWGEYQCMISLRDITEGLDCNSWAVFTLGSIDLPCWSTFTLGMLFGARACLPLSTVQYSRWQYALTHCCRKYPWTMESSLLQAITWPVF